MDVDLGILLQRGTLLDASLKEETMSTCPEVRGERTIVYALTFAQRKNERQSPGWPAQKIDSSRNDRIDRQAVLSPSSSTTVKHDKSQANRNVKWLSQPLYGAKYGLPSLVLRLVVR